MLRTIIAIIALAAVVVAAGGAFFVFAKQPQPVDVCRELHEIEAATNQVAKFNHRLRVRRPELRNDRDSSGATLELISVYSQITDAERKLGCR
jgi:anti-sigma-K factor RskA